MILIPKVRFMVHDRWANVLFLHWRIPAHLEETLVAHTAPFVVERYDGSAWIGLILLTEEGVGPSIGRSRWTCVTHHGINVRTYVRGVSESIHKKSEDDDEDKNHHNDTKDPSLEPKCHETTAKTTRGIHFSSLECDDEFTSYGANFFGMPYRVATMARSFQYWMGSSGVAAEEDNRNAASPTRRSRCRYTIRSERLPSGNPSLVRMLFHALTWWRPRVLHSITTTTNTGAEISGRDPEPNHPVDRGDESGVDSERFSVDCAWSCPCKTDAVPSRSDDDENTTDPFHDWAAERYYVYTHRYGQNWRGKVDHEPWPVDATSVSLERLVISGVEAYEPRAMRPVLRYMAEHQPDRVGFSTGVGPVDFTMLQPV